MAGVRQRVLFLSSSLAGGGAERFVSTVLVHLDRARFEPLLCLLRHEVDYPLPTDVPVDVLDKRRPWQLPRAILRCARTLDRRRPDVVVSAFAYPTRVAGGALGLAQRRPRWLARVSLPTGDTDPPWLRPWMRRLYRRADAVVANSRALCRDVETRYGVATRHLPNATDFAALECGAGTPVPPPAPGRPRLLSLGRLEPQKRHDRLLEAVARLAEPELVICGEGPERARLERRARELGVADRVRLPGFVAQPFAWLRSADLFVLASDAEGLPNALVEAQGAGLAAVVTDCPSGPAEVVAHGETGLVVPPGDTDALVAAVAELLRDEPRRRRMGQAARARARARWDAAATTRALESLLLELTGD